jgi:hypothetical protein
VDGSALCEVIRCDPDGDEFVSTRRLSGHCSPLALARRASRCLRMQHVVMPSDMADISCGRAFDVVMRCAEPSFCLEVRVHLSLYFPQHERLDTSNWVSLQAPHIGCHCQLLTLPQYRRPLMANETSFSCRFRSLLVLLDVVSCPFCSHRQDSGLPSEALVAYLLLSLACRFSSGLYGAQLVTSSLQLVVDDNAAISETRLAEV